MNVDLPRSVRHTAACDCQELTSNWRQLHSWAAAPTPRLPVRPSRRSASAQHGQCALSRLERAGYESPANIAKGECRVRSWVTPGMGVPTYRRASLPQPTSALPTRPRVALCAQYDARRLSFRRRAGVASERSRHQPQHDAYARLPAPPVLPQTPSHQLHGGQTGRGVLVGGEVGFGGLAVVGDAQGSFDVARQPEPGEAVLEGGSGFVD